MANNPLYKTARWRKIREAQLRFERSCRRCGALATVCDHVTPHRGDEGMFFAGPFQSLCTACHSSGKQFEENHGFSREIGRDGWPLDPRHPANVGGRG